MLNAKWFKKLDSNKTRMLLLIGMAVVFLVVVILVFTSKKPDPLKTEESRTTQIPQITAIPGGATSEKYQQLQEAENRRLAEQAQKTGGSAIATIIGNKDNDLLSKKETFGIEGEFLNAGDCKCPQGSASTTTKRICPKDFDAALKAVATDKAAAKKLLQECPAIASLMAQKYPELFKQLMLDNPDLAKLIAGTNPEIFKKLMESDPQFLNQIANTNPDLVKNLLSNDPDFAATLGKTHPDVLKDLMRDDAAFSTKIAQNNPGLTKSLLLNDPDFSKLMSQNNPDMMKNLMKGDPGFSKDLAQNNPTLVKELLKNDPAFTDAMADQNPELLKNLALNDSEFSKSLAKNNPDTLSHLMDSDSNFAKTLAQKVPDLQTIMDNSRKKSPFLNDKQRLQALEDERRKQRDAELKRARQTQLSENQQKKLSALMANMEAQSKNILDGWSTVTPQAFIQGDKKDGNGSGNAGNSAGTASTGGSTASESGTNKVLIKAGTIFFAVLDTAVNTDEPGPVMATIVQGDKAFEGAKAIGSVQMASQPGNDRPEKVTLTFTTLSAPNLPKSLTIQAVAIDTDTARTALASDVDHHYLLRYGTLFASSFMNGYAKVITSAGTVQTNSGTGATTTTTPPLSARKEVFAALGEVGKKFGEATSTFFSTPNTITVNAGTGVGLLILSDVTGS